MCFQYERLYDQSLKSENLWNDLKSSYSTLAEHWRLFPLSSSGTNGDISLSNIMIARVTLINHLRAHPGALIPQHMRVRAGRGGATVHL